MPRKPRETARVEIIVFELEDVYHADVVNFGEVIHTTEGYIDWDSARWAALDWAKDHFKKND